MFNGMHVEGEQQVAGVRLTRTPPRSSCGS